jgi:hypothetical protein
METKSLAGESQIPCILYREITIKEAVYQDGLRAIVDARARCFHPSGRPMAYQEATNMANESIQKGDLMQSLYPRESVLFALFQSWLVDDLKWRLKSSAEISCVYLDEKSGCEPAATRYSAGTLRRTHGECEPKCNVP